MFQLCNFWRQNICLKCEHKIDEVDYIHSYLRCWLHLRTFGKVKLIVISTCLHFIRIILFGHLFLHTMRHPFTKFGRDLLRKLNSTSISQISFSPENKSVAYQAHKKEGQHQTWAQINAILSQLDFSGPVWVFCHILGIKKLIEQHISEGVWVSGWIRWPLTDPVLMNCSPL